ncbi:MAG: hypothetical protein H6654_11585 [Ardenticatenaceae bacterium]|nr:hypothetical protein [Anaerolineales bacterium]MCB8937621.1 hypothetical protein [Ardenticatenaceae bacterium]MCB8974190.1 hypothetical protein [Ardenticatenaceae bacterium]
MKKFNYSFFLNTKLGSVCFLFGLLFLLLVSCNTSPDPEQLETAVPEPTIPVEATNQNSNELSAENTQVLPDIQSVTIQKFGFSQTEDQIGYGVIFFNPNKVYFVNGVLFSVTLFDANNNLLQVYGEQLDFIAPEEEAGVGGTIELEAGQTVHRIEVKIDGQVETSLLAPLLIRYYTLPQNISFDEETYTVNTDGFVVNAFPDNSNEAEIKGRNNIRVTAIALDTAGNIVGGGDEIIPQTVRNGTVSPASVSIPIISSQPPETIEIYSNQGHKGGLCAVILGRNNDSASALCPLTTHTGG